MVIKKICQKCNSIFYIKPYRKNIAKYCSRKCANISFYENGGEVWNKNLKNPFSKETIKKMSEAKKGMHLSPNTEFKKENKINIGRKHSFETREKISKSHYKGGHINKNGYKLLTRFGKRILEHHHIWNKENGILPRGYHIHHINGNKLDNRIENLQCLSISAHTKLHHRQGDIHGGMKNYNN